MIKIIILLLISFPILAQNATPVLAYRVTTSSMPQQLQTIGIAQAYQSINIQMPTQGIIKQISFKAGDKVNKGQTIVKQYDALLKNQKKLNQLQINKTSSHDKKKNRKNLAFQQALLNLQKIQLQIEQKQFNAPFSGTLGLLKVAKGALVTPQTTIAQFTDTSQMRINFDVPEKKINTIKKGQTVTITSKHHPMLKKQGKISFIDNKLNKNTRSITLQAIINNTKGSIKQGQFLTVTVQQNQTPNTIYISNAAIQTENNRHYVYVIKNNIVTKTAIQMGQHKAKQSQIIKGLKGNEVIVARGLAQLKDKAQVTIIDYIAQ